MRIRSPSGCGARQRARRGARRDEDGVGVVRRASSDDHPARSVEAAAAGDDLHALLVETAGDVGGLVGGELHDPLVDHRQVDGDRDGLVALVVVEATPSSAAPPTSVISSAVAISVLLGTQSVRTAEPPIPSLSTTVTSAPSWAATRAAS